VIRPARSEDVPFLLAIQDRWKDLPKWSETHFREEIGREGARLAVILVENQVAGYGSLRILAGEGQVLMIAIDPAFARAGFGKRLLAHLLSEAQRAGCAKVTLEVSARNAAALALYKSSGFVEVGRRPKFYPDGSDAVFMDALLSK